MSDAELGSAGFLRFADGYVEGTTLEDYSWLAGCMQVISGKGQAFRISGTVSAHSIIFGVHQRSCYLSFLIPGYLQLYIIALPRVSSSFSFTFPLFTLFTKNINSMCDFSHETLTSSGYWRQPKSHSQSWSPIPQQVSHFPPAAPP